MNQLYLGIKDERRVANLMAGHLKARTPSSTPTSLLYKKHENLSPSWDERFSIRENWRGRRIPHRNVSLFSPSEYPPLYHKMARNRDKSSKNLSVLTAFLM